MCYFVSQGAKLLFWLVYLLRSKVTQNILAQMARADNGSHSRERFAHRLKAAARVHKSCATTKARIARAGAAQQGAHRLSRIASPALLH